MKKNCKIISVNVNYSLNDDVELYIVDEQEIKIGDTVAERLLDKTYDLFKIDTLNDIDQENQKRVFLTPDKITLGDFERFKLITSERNKELDCFVEMEEYLGEGCGYRSPKLDENGKVYLKF